MAHVQKRTWQSGTTTYVVRWRTPDGAERTKGGFPTRKAAKDYVVTEVEPKLRRGLSFDPDAGKLLFRDAAQAWLTSRADLKATTLAAYREALAPTTAETAKRHKRLAHLSIDPVFGGYPLNAITREQISEWVQRMQAAGKRPSTVRNAYFLVRQVLGQAVEDGRLDSNPADYVRLPTEHNTGTGAVVDDPALFLTAAQVAALVDSTPWPYNVLVHVAAWAGLRAGELAGLQLGDVELTRGGSLRVDRTVARVGKELVYLTPKTKGSRRRVPLTPQTATLLRDYLAMHPHADDPTAPLFPAVRLAAPRPTGVAARTADGTPEKLTAKERADRQLAALAALSLDEAEARLVLDWSAPLRHATFYKAVFRPAVARANRLYPNAALPSDCHPHTLRHTYASLCVAAGIPMFEISRFMGHAKPSTTETVYAHLLGDDHTVAMAALGSIGTRPNYSSKVVPLHR
jgi:integrase